MTHFSAKNCYRYYTAATLAIIVICMWNLFTDGVLAAPDSYSTSHILGSALLVYLAFITPMLIGVLVYYGFHRQNRKGILLVNSFQTVGSIALWLGIVYDIFLASGAFNDTSTRYHMLAYLVMLFLAVQIISILLYFILKKRVNV